MVKHSSVTKALIIAILVVVASVLGLPYAMEKFGMGAVTEGPGAAPAGGVSCPTDGDTTVSLTIRNQLQDTTREVYNATAYFYKMIGGTESMFGSLTNTDGTTTSSDLNVDCGDTYRIRVVSADGNGGDSGKLLGIDAGTGAKVIDSGKAIEFVAQKSNYNLEIQSKQHGVLQARSWDNNEGAWMYNNIEKAAADANNYEPTGTTFLSTANGTIAVGSGGDVSWTMDLEVTAADVDFGDFGWIILVDASTSIWDIPSIAYNGKSLTEITPDSETSRAHGGTYEYFFETQDSVSDIATDLDIEVSALSGVDPGGSDNIVLSFLPIGASRETAGNGIRYSPVTDAASPANVFTIQTYTYDIS